MNAAAVVVLPGTTTDIPVVTPPPTRRLLSALTCGLARCNRWADVGTFQHLCVSFFFGGCRDASEGKGPQRRPQKRLDRRLEEVAKAVGGGHCRLRMPLKLALGVRETVAGRRLGALEGGEVPWRRPGGGGYLPP